LIIQSFSNLQELQLLKRNKTYENLRFRN
jgi:hypothetical protein